MLGSRAEEVRRPVVSPIPRPWVVRWRVLGRTVGGVAMLVSGLGGAPGLASALAAAPAVGAVRAAAFWGDRAVRRTSPPRASGLVRWMAPRDTTPEAQLATITTDTGAFAPGHRDFGRYDTPWLCRAAALSARAAVRRSLAAQQLGDTLVMDTVGLGAVAGVARACGARFTLATTPAWGRWALFELAIFEQNDSLALAVLATQPGGEVRGMTALLSYGRLTAAQALLARVEAREPAGVPLQRELHALLREWYSRDTQDAGWPRLAQEDSLLIQQGLHPAPGEHGYPAVLRAYRDLMHHALLHAPATVAALVLAAQRDLGQFSVQEQEAGDHGYPPGNYVHRPRDQGDWRTLPADTVISMLSPIWYVHARYGVRVPAPRLRADFWWPAPGAGAGDTVVPVAGKVNLICGGGQPTDFVEDRSKEYHVDAYQRAVSLKRWLAQYGAAGLVATVVRGTEINVPNYLHFSFLPYGGLVHTLDSTEAAGFWHWYDQLYHQVPVTEAVVVQHTTAWLPAPDGRRLVVAPSVPNGYIEFNTQDSHLEGEPQACTLVDRDGRIVYHYPDNLDNGTGYWKGWGEVLQWLFTNPAGGGAPHA